MNLLLYQQHSILIKCMWYVRFLTGILFLFHLSRLFVAHHRRMSAWRVTSIKANNMKINDGFRHIYEYIYLVYFFVCPIFPWIADTALIWRWSIDFMICNNESRYIDKCIYTAMGIVCERYYVLRSPLATFSPTPLAHALRSLLFQPFQWFRNRKITQTLTHMVCVCPSTDWTCIWKTI